MFEDDSGRQIVVIIKDSTVTNESESGFEIRLFCEPPGMGVCEAAFHYATYELAEKMFVEKVNKAWAVNLAKKIYAAAPEANEHGMSSTLSKENGKWVAVDGNGVEMIVET